MQSTPTGTPRAAAISGTIGNHRRVIGNEWIASLAGGEHTLVLENGAARFEDGETLTVAGDWTPGRRHAVFTVAGARMSVKVDLSGPAIRLRRRGMDVTAHVREPHVAALARLMPKKLPPDTSKLLLCPMPGVATAILVAEGDVVEAGQPLATIEAMKMENVMKAERRGTVKRVAVKVGQSLAVDETILEFA